MFRNLKILATLFTILVMGAAVSVSNASANSVGQCNVHPGSDAKTGLQVYKNWKTEGVSTEAAKLVLKKAGWKAVDGSALSFMKDRVVRTKLAKTAAGIKDYRCSGGSLFSAGTRTEAKGEEAFVVLPVQYSKNDVSLVPKAGYEKKLVGAYIVARVHCSNPFFKFGYIYIWVPVTPEKKEPKKKPKKHHEQPKPAPEVPSEAPKTQEPPPAPKPEQPSIMITSTTTLNMIPAGKNSGDFYIGTYASTSGGTLTIDPEIGSVSSCDSSTPEDSFVVSVPAGASKQCVIIYAPEDAEQPEWMMVTETVNLGSAREQWLTFFELTYPVRA